MRYQPKDKPYCGPAALSNALEALGKRKSFAQLLKLCKTNDEGTSHRGILNACTAIGVFAEEYKQDKDRQAKQWLLANATLGVPLILCVDSWEHWVCIAGHCGERVWLFDSSNEAWNIVSNGAWLLKPTEVLRRWKASRRIAESDSRYYAIALHKKSDG